MIPWLALVITQPTDPVEVGFEDFGDFVTKVGGMLVALVVTMLDIMLGIRFLLLAKRFD